MKKIYFITWLFTLMMCMGLSSCGDEPEIMEIPESGTDSGTDEDANTETEPGEDTAYIYADVHFILNCSEDLLNYVTPQVTYINEEGRSVTVQIADSEWEENKEVNFGITFDDASFDAKIMKYIKTIRFKEFPIDDEMTVTYLPKANMPAYDRNRLNMFYHNLTVTMDFVDEKNNYFLSTSSQYRDVSYKLNFTLDEIVEFYIENMGIPYINQDEYRTSGIILGASNDAIKKIINDYQDVQGISVESDGTYALKYDADDLSVFKEEPKVDITYTLNCSADLLEHAIPEVIYIGDDGKTVTYQLNMSDFEVNERVNKWGQHLHGDELFTDGEEDALIMKWTKQIHYDNLQAVDDEITVRYIPRDNTEKLRISHIYHNLSTAFCLVDIDGGIKWFTSANKIKSNIVEGEDRLAWKFMDSSGNLICFETTSFADLKFLDSDGTPRKAGDMIVQSYKDYQGYHIENDGTYIQK